MSVGGGSVCSGGEGTSFVSTGSRKGQECEWCLISFSKFLPEKNQSVVLSMLSPRNKQRLGTAPQHVLQLLLLPSLNIRAFHTVVLRRRPARFLEPCAQRHSLLQGWSLTGNRGAPAPRMAETSNGPPPFLNTS